MYKDRLCSDEMVDCLGYGSTLVEGASADVHGDQRGQFYEVYMRKREMKLREEWRVKGAEKDAEMRARMESLASIFLRTTREKLAEAKQRTKEEFKELSEVHHSDSIFSDDHFAHTKQRKLISSNSSSVSSSTSQSSATATPKPNIRSSTSASLRKENTKPSAGIKMQTTMQRSIGRSSSSNERMCLVKDMKTRRPQNLRRNSSSLGEPMDFMTLNSFQHVNVNPSPRRAEPMPLLKSRNGEVRIPISSGSSTSVEQSNEMLRDADKDRRKLMFCKEPRAQSLLSMVQEASDFDPSSHSPRHHSAAESSQHMNLNMEGKTHRERKKWGSVERPLVAVDASVLPLMDVTKGIKRLLKLGKKSRELDIGDGKDARFVSATIL
ncbi:hypothetical protein HPP92_010683 [Vanilla planifolia]|uniref:Uncharacterized protein n=1 Tax=Vanilla planifolia TaxID=51239 RepID=A0A835R1D9_VANPL|nr:hypothetical protein HPP92_010683 [Vanilla planifolia]